MNKDNIFFLRHTKYPALGNDKYIAIENYSDRLVIFYSWAQLCYWVAYREFYKKDLAREEWNHLIQSGYVRVKDPYPMTRVGNGVTEERIII